MTRNPWTVVLLRYRDGETDLKSQELKEWIRRLEKLLLYTVHLFTKR